MKRILWAKLPIRAAMLTATAAWQLGTAGSAWAQQPYPPPPPVVAAPAPEAPASTAMAAPSMTGPLVANPNPYSFDDPFGYFGKIYVTGALTGLALVQSNPVAGDHLFRGDASNAQLIVQKPEGLFQFYVQAGMYALPALGTPYVSAWRTTGDTFTPLPVAYAKLAPTDEFSIQAGKLPTLIGAEYAFTFQNMNIERGLLWNQEPIISRGVQANYTLGPLAFSASLNDGFYSDSYNWLTGSAAWTINKENTLTVVGGGNFDHTDKNAFSGTLPVVVKTPFFQNNGDVFNIIYTYNAAPWTITPYFQYTSVPRNPFLGAIKGAETFGGAILANYAVNDNVNVAGRAEYISSSGSLGGGNANVLYGPGSSAWSLTFTPTYQEGIYFLREEVSFVQANSITPGFAFGKSGGSHSQARLLLEAGIIF
jgi:Putative beta-barrel porin-2, OmpL-like. bbp2